MRVASTARSRRPELVILEMDAPDLGKVSPLIHRWNGVVRSQRDNLVAVGGEESVACYGKCADSLLYKCPSENILNPLNRL